MFQLRVYQQKAVEKGLDFLLGNEKCGAIIVAPMGCLSGDTIINLNIRKNSRKTRLEDAYRRYNGLDWKNYNYKFKNDIKIRSMMNGSINLNYVDDIVYSGKRITIKIILNNGKYLILTPDHKIFSENGWINAVDSVGKKIAFDETPRAIKNVEKYVRHRDVFVNIGKYHPYSRKVVDKRDGSVSYRIEKHRAIYESYINGFDNIEQYKNAIINGTKLLFINPEIYHVHHKDFNHKNNDKKNLIHLTKKEHHTIHIEQSKKNFGQGKIGYLECVNIEYNGIIDTYDICCRDPYNNFIANGVVVHNSGKSVLVSAIAKQLEGNTLVLQPSKELVEQNVAKAVAIGIDDIKIFSASCGQKEIGKCTFATIGSIIKRKDLLDSFQHLIIDECDLVNARGGMYEELINHMGGKVLGMTATPYRLHAYNDFKTGQLSVVAKFLNRTRPRIFSKIIHITQIQELYDQKYLCPIEYELNANYNHSDLKLNSTGMNFDEKSVELYNQSHQIIEIAAKIVSSEESRHILVFMQSVAESAKFSEYLQSSGISSASISAKTPKNEREDILRRFKSGEIRVVSNVQCLTVGFDFPELDCIIVARPTQSIRLFQQILGRGIRLAPGKEKCRVIDLAGNVNRFGKIENFEIVEHKTGMHRLKSNTSYLTGYDFYHNIDLESQNYAGLKETEFKRNDDIIRFGRYKGQHVSKLPNDYLNWCRENMKGSWQEMFKKELIRRELSRKEKLAAEILPF